MIKINPNIFQMDKYFDVLAYLAYSSIWIIGINKIWIGAGYVQVQKWRILSCSAKWIIDILYTRAFQLK